MLSSLAAHRMMPGPPLINATIEVSGSAAVSGPRHDLWRTVAPESTTRDIGGGDRTDQFNPDSIGRRNI